MQRSDGTTKELPLARVPLAETLRIIAYLYFGVRAVLGAVDKTRCVGDVLF